MIHELLITAFVILTAPVVAMLLMRTAVYRDLRARDRRPTVSANESKTTTEVYPFSAKEEP